MQGLKPPHLRLLMTTDTAGGVWDYSIELASGLRHHGVQTVLAVIGGSIAESQRQEIAEIPDLQLEQGDFKFEWMQDAERDIILAGDWLLTLNDKYQPDIVHINSYSFASLPWNRPCVLVAHSCILSWWWQVKKESPPDDFMNYATRVADGLKNADATVFLTASLKKAMDKIYGPTQRSRIIWNGRNAEKYRSSRKEPFIFSAGRLWDEAKNFFCLDYVADDLSWPVLIAGTCTGPDGYSRRPEKCEYLGSLPSSEMIDKFSKASIFVHPARYEPFGLAVLEAGMAGCALVLSDIATFRELWMDAAVFVPCDDTRLLRNTINDLIADPDGMSDLGKKAHVRALTYSSQRMCRKYHSLYMELLSENIVQRIHRNH